MSIKSKRLSIFLPGMYDGGAERSMLKLAKGIADRGYAVDLVLVRSEGPYMAEIPESVRLVDLKAHRILTSLPAFFRYLQQEQPASLLSVLNVNIIALWARRLSRLPTRVVVSERNTLSCLAQHYVSDLRMRYTPFLNKYFYPWADAIVAVSKGVADDLSLMTGIFRDRIRVIYNPIITPELQANARVPLEHPWFKPCEPPVILAVGRLTAQKDFSTLISAFAQVRKNRQARLLILGEGEDRKLLEALAEQLGVASDVSLPGFDINPYPYMARASLFVLSSRWEGLPGVLIEALYCGAPIVATDCPSGPREILGDQTYGKLVPVRDVNALAQAMTATLNEEKKRPPRKSWQPFELETVTEQYINVLLGS